MIGAVADTTPFGIDGYETHEIAQKIIFKDAIKIYEYEKRGVHYYLA
jgi:hypothetical protein